MAVERAEQVYKEAARLFNAGDTLGLSNLYEPNGKFILPEGEVVGRDAIRQRYDRFLQVGGTIENELVGAYEADGVAVTAQVWKFVGQDGKMLIRGEGIKVLREGKDGWLIALDCPFGIG